MAARDEGQGGRDIVRPDADDGNQLAHDVDRPDRLVEMLLGIVEERDVDALELEPLETLDERASDSGRAVVEDGLERAGADETCLRAAWPEDTADLRRDDVLATRSRRQRLSETLLRETGPVQGSGVEIADAHRPRLVDRRSSIHRRDLAIEARDWGGAEADSREAKRRAVIHTTYHLNRDRSTALSAHRR